MCADVTNHTIVTVSVGLLIELEFYLDNTSGVKFIQDSVVSLASSMVHITSPKPMPRKDCGQLINEALHICWT